MGSEPRSNYRCLLLSAICTLMLLSASISAEQDNTDYVTGELLIQLTSDKSPQSIADDFSSIGLKPKKLLSGRMNIWLFEYPESGLKSADHERVLSDIRGHAGVERGQFNHRVTERATLPDDPGFGQQWGLNNTGQSGGVVDADIDAPEAWDLATSGSTAEGDQIVVAIVDGGCDLAHPDIAFFKNVHETPGNGIDDDGNGYIDDYDGWDAYDSDGTIPGYNHGTHVAGIAAATGNNATGVSGVNWNVKVMPIAGSSTVESVVLEAYGYILEMRSRYNETDGAYGAFVVSSNSSFGVDYGDPVNFPLWCAFYDSLGAAGVLSAAATANIGMNIDINGDVPTACPSDYMISVTNTTRNDVRNSGAGYGLTTIDLGAPGTNVYSTLQGGGYGNSTGTSMATPHVAGAVGFMYSVASPGLIAAAKQHPDSVALKIKDAILNGTDPNASLDGLTVTGGRLNLHGAALEVLAIPTGASIAHTPLADTRDTLNDYEVLAVIRSDTALAGDSLLLFYELASVWTEVTLAATGGADEYHAYIPAQPAGTSINYYLYALDTKGRSDTTDVYSFEVIDYGLTLEPDESTNNGAVADTIWFDLRVTNSGVLADSYNLGVVSTKWGAAVYDETMTSEITSTATLLGDEFFDLKVRVIVPVSIYGNADTSVVEALSTSDPSFSASATVITTSDGQPVILPFDEDFGDGLINTAYWVQQTGVQINSNALDEPSAPYSLNLNGNPTGADTVVSQAIYLKNESNVLVRYHFEQTGGGDSPEAGDDLFVEYLDSTNTWQLISQHLGADPSMTAFEEVVYYLPGTAMHSGFRLRLRSIGTPGAFDDWFVDDVFIGHPAPFAMEVTPSAATRYGSAGDTATFMLKVFNKGANTDNYMLHDSGSVWDIGLYDETGTTPITSTGLITGGDSLAILARVAVPSEAAMNESSLSLVYLVSTNSPYVFDSTRLTTISAGPPGGFPWYEPFPDDSLLTVRWIYNAGATVSSAAASPPSIPYALVLDGGIDTVISSTINLGGQSGAQLSYYYQRGGSEPPDPGDDLRIEYKNSSGTWITASLLDGDGPPMTTFSQVVTTLPGDALHTNFQLRLHSIGSCEDCDIWFIDDIRIDHVPEIDVQPLSFTIEVDQGDSTAAQLFITNSGPGGLDYTLNALPPTGSSPLATLLAAGELEPARRTYPEGFDDLVLAKGQVDDRVGFPVLRDAGGPDTYGYFWIDSDQEGGPLFDWIDATISGNDIVADLGDDAFGGPYRLGFNFPFYDSLYDQIYIGSNGIIGFGPDDMASRFKRSIPNDTMPNNILAWLWKDLNPADNANPNAAVYVDTTGDRCVIQFVDYPDYLAETGDLITAEVVLYPDGSIVYQYLEIAPGFDAVACMVGIENASGTDGLEVAYLAPYLKDSLAIKFTNPYQWLTFGQSSGALVSETADTVAVRFNAATLDSGLFEASIVVHNNDPDEDPLVIPVSLTVAYVPQYVCGDASGDGSSPNVADLTYLVAYLFQGGPAPPVPAAADADGSGGNPTVSDITYLVSHLFQGGPPPICEG